MAQARLKRLIRRARLALETGLPLTTGEVAGYWGLAPPWRGIPSPGRAIAAAGSECLDPGASKDRLRT